MSSLMRGRGRVLAACVAATCTLAGVVGCASPYGEAGLTGGYQSNRLDATHWYVQYDGNGYTPNEQVWAYWIYRCAEVTRQSGYAYFAMLPATWKPAADPQAGAVRAPAAWLASTPARALSDPAVWRASDKLPLVQAHSGGGGGFVYIPGGTYTVKTWHTKGVIATFNAPVPATTMLVLSAQSVMDDLAPYVKQGKPHPIDRDLMVAHGLRWISDTGAALPLMAPPAAPAATTSAPMGYARPRAQPTLHAGLAS